MKKDGPPSFYLAVVGAGNASPEIDEIAKAVVRETAHGGWVSFAFPLPD